MPGIFHRVCQHVAAMVLNDFGYDATIHDQADKGRALTPFIADVVGRFKGSASAAEAAKRKRIVYVECQTEITTEWLTKIKTNYANLNVIIIDLKKMDTPLDEPIWDSDAAQGLYDRLYAQIDIETAADHKEKADKTKSKPWCWKCKAYLEDEGLVKHWRRVHQKKEEP